MKTYLQVLTSVLISSSFLVSACSNVPTFVAKPPAQNSSDGGAGDSGNSDNPDGGSNRGFNDPLPPDACQVESRTENFSIRPSSIQGANVVLTIDDSGSMGAGPSGTFADSEIKRVIEQVPDLAQGLLNITDGNYRIAYIFKYLGSDISGFGDGSAFNNYGGNISNDFQVDNVHSFHFNVNVGSCTSDIAFFRIFGQQATFLQPNYSGGLEGVNYVPALSFPGTYLRMPELVNGKAHDAIDSVSAKFFQVAADTSMSTKNVSIYQNRIENYLIPGVSVHHVTFTDDNLKVVKLRAANDPQPDVDYRGILEMYQEVLEPLGDAPFFYHSVVGLSGDLGISSVGRVHQQLSQTTGGLVHSITASSYAEIFDELRNQVIFSEQTVGLDCTPRSIQDVEVTFNGQVLDPSLYTVSLSEKKVRIRAEVFEGLDPNALYPVVVSYRL